MSTTTFIAEPHTQQVVLSRDLAAPRDVVWRTLTNPDLIGQWWGPAYLTTEVDEYDLRPGGRWRFIQRDPDGNEFAFHGFFHVIDEATQVVQTFEFEGLPERHVLMETATLTESAGVTTLINTSVFQSTADRDGMVASGMEQGAVGGMERLAAIVERSLAGFDPVGVAMRILAFDDLRSRPGAVARFQGADHGAATSFYVVSSPPGRGADKHRHPYEEIFIILGGDIDVTVGDETDRLGAGHVVIIPPRTWHGFVNRGNADASMVNIHASATMIQEDWDVVVHGDARG